MNNGPIASLPDWSVDDLRGRMQELQARGIRGTLYDKKVVDQLLVDLFGAFQAKDRDIQAARRHAEAAQEKQAEAEAAAQGYITQLQLFTEDHPDQVIMPLQAQKVMERAQEEADRLVIDAQDYAKNLLEDAETNIEAMIAEAQASVRAVGHLSEPEGQDHIARAEWLDAAADYITLRRQEWAVELKSEISRLQIAHTKMIGTDDYLNPEADLDP